MRQKNPKHIRFISSVYLCGPAGWRHDLIHRASETMLEAIEATGRANLATGIRPARRLQLTTGAGRPKRSRPARHHRRNVSRRSHYDSAAIVLTCIRQPNPPRTILRCPSRARSVATKNLHGWSTSTCQNARVRRLTRSSRLELQDTTLHGRRFAPREVRHGVPTLSFPADTL